MYALVNSRDAIRALYNMIHATLTHWGRVTHICVSNLTIIASDNGLSPGGREAIILTNADFIVHWTLGNKFQHILMKIINFPFKKTRLKMSSAKWRPARGVDIVSHDCPPIVDKYVETKWPPFCLGLNVLILRGGMTTTHYWQGKVNTCF